jgi:hypothetical protein
VGIRTRTSGQPPFARAALPPGERRSRGLTTHFRERMLSP